MRYETLKAFCLLTTSAEKLLNALKIDELKSCAVSSIAGALVCTVMCS